MDVGSKFESHQTNCYITKPSTAHLEPPHIFSEIQRWARPHLPVNLDALTHPLRDPEHDQIDSLRKYL